MNWLIDTNVLIALRNERDPNHTLAQDLLDRHRRPMCDAVICAQVLIEFWAVSTRPQAANGFGRTTPQVAADLDDLSQLPLLKEPPDIFSFWQKLVIRFDVKGRPTHDARLVALMDAHGIVGLITLNPRDFTRYPHLNILTPQQWLTDNPKQPTA